METILFTSIPSIAYQLADPGVVLFGVALVLLTAALAFASIYSKVPSVWLPLFVFLLVALFAVKGMIVIELFNAGGMFYTFGFAQTISELFSAHRLLLLMLLPFLLFVCLGIVGVYRLRISEQHAKPYRLTLVITLAVAFLIHLLIGFESLV